MERTEFGERLRLSREAAGLLGADIAAELGVDVRTLYRWERGEFEPSIGTLVWLADRYGVSQVYLTTGLE